MSEKKSDDLLMGLQVINMKDFDDYRNVLVERFNKKTPLFKRKLTQSLYWTSLDKDLANQFYRDERWFCGFKYCDTVKLIDHGAEGMSTKGIGYGRK
jgi:hypothetical protein